MDSSPTPAPSNGLPVLPVSWVPWLTMVVGLAAVLVNVLTPGTVAFQIASGVLALGSVLGLASPGLRTHAPDTAKALEAGKAASATVDTQAKAVDVLKSTKP